MRFTYLIWSLLGVLTTLGFENKAQAQATASFISLPPCRIVDTRDTNRGTLGRPALIGMAQRSFAVLSAPCGVPATATAYSLNVTVVPYGPFSYLTIWPTGQQQPLVSTLNAYAGTVVANAAIVPAGTNGSISVFVTGKTELIIDIDGYFAPPSTQVLDTLAQSLSQDEQKATTLGTSVAQAAQQISVLQQQAGVFSAGLTQTAQQIVVLQQGLATATTNVGQIPGLVTATNQILNAVRSDSAQQNIAFGNQTSLDGSQNSAVGSQALQLNSQGSANTAVGAGALLLNTTGSNNVGLGAGVLGANQTGNGNIAIGNGSGSSIGSADNTIEIGNPGQPGDAAVIRIGTQGTHQTTFVAGIYQSGTDPYGTAVLVDDTGMLGTFQSSIRYKEDVQDIGAASSDLMRLRPVQFRYKKPSRRGDKPIQYGLIAEEVEKVFPNLVVRDSQGRVETVQYHQLPALLLKAIQEQHRQLAEQSKLIQQQGEQIKSLLKRLPVP